MNPYWRRFLKNNKIMISDLTTKKLREIVVNKILTEVSAEKLAKLGLFTQSNLRLVKRGPNGSIISLSM